MSSGVVTIPISYGYVVCGREIRRERWKSPFSLSFPEMERSFPDPDKV